MRSIRTFIVSQRNFHLPDEMKQFTTLLAFVASVWAHGYVDNGTIGGVFYQVNTHLSHMRRDLQY